MDAACAPYTRFNACSTEKLVYEPRDKAYHYDCTPWYGQGTSVYASISEAYPNRMVITTCSDLLSIGYTVFEIGIVVCPEERTVFVTDACDITPSPRYKINLDVIMWSRALHERQHKRGEDDMTMVMGLCPGQLPGDLWADIVCAVTGVFGSHYRVSRFTAKRFQALRARHAKELCRATAAFFAAANLPGPAVEAIASHIKPAWFHATATGMVH